VRQIATTRPTTCGCCRRPVKLLETVRSVTLLEEIRLPCGSVVEGVHTCPDEAVHRWEQLAALARLARRGTHQTASRDA
jgi:hypothetical protein